MFEVKKGTMIWMFGFLSKKEFEKYFKKLHFFKYCSLKSSNFPFDQKLEIKELKTDI